MTHSSTDTQLPVQDPKEIPKWSRAYAQNRSLGVVVFLIAFAVIFAAISVGSYVAGNAYRSGNMPLFFGAIVVLVPALAATVVISVPRWSARLQGLVIQRLYRREGNVALASNSKAKSWGLVLGMCFGTCILASVVMGFAFDIPSKYVQPISATFVVPFLVGQWFLMRPMTGYVSLLWPGLYALHAILILTGAPIVFASPWDSLNMLIPTVGYGILTGLIAHVYSRVALRNLKQLTQSNLDAETIQEATE